MKDAIVPAALRVVALSMMTICICDCSAGSAAAADPDKVDPCKLITQAEAQSALGMPVKPGAFMDSGYRFCSFKPAGEGTYYLSISLISVDKAGFDQADPNQERATGTSLDAFFTKNNDVLSVWHAGNQLQVQIHFGDGFGASEATVRNAELKIAEVAVARF